MTAYLESPTEAEGKPISDQRKFAFRLTTIGAMEIVQTEKKGKPGTGHQPCVLFTPKELEALKLPTNEADFAEVIATTGSEWNPRSHPSDPSTEKRTWLVFYSRGHAMVAPYLAVKGRQTEAKSKASAKNGALLAKLRAKKTRR